jgi:hypothetical protein
MSKTLEEKYETEEIVAKILLFLLFVGFAPIFGPSMEMFASYHPYIFFILLLIAVGVIYCVLLFSCAVLRALIS